MHLEHNASCQDQLGQQLKAESSNNSKARGSKTLQVVSDVENTFAKFTWAKEAQKNIENLKEEGKPMPKNLADQGISVSMMYGPHLCGNSLLIMFDRVSRFNVCMVSVKSQKNRQIGAFGMSSFSSTFIW
ncbi:uncharacterized protein LOC132038480 [Lycium ferocissimum]|uniref:uncharacterized protein LOC132038480 n=1 Tax=Lycium ferocissimum TaxID=112874 RepID=UPI0028159B05|nr:uncharacterized protein LOC132038480 [Lycium ferocissimum]